MNVIPTRIPDVLLLEPKVYGDERGFFMETWNARRFRDAGIDVDFVQDNHSRSVKHTLRGLHYQVKQAQGKLVRVTRGAVYDVAVDIRPQSPSFGQWVGMTLSEENQRMLWIPPGFAHGFLVTSESADFQYKCSDYYAPEFERTIFWADEQLGIDWPLEKDICPIVSDKDARGAPFADLMHDHQT